MSINSINSYDLLSSIYATAYAPPTQGIGQNSQSVSGSTEQIDISMPGKLMNAISQMSDKEKAKMETFRQELKDAVENGTFDAETMAASAPDALASFAEENGIELTQMLQNMADGLANNEGVYGPPPPPPPMMSGMSGLDLSSLEDLNDDEKGGIRSFLEDLTSSVQDGTFDAETLAASAPDALANLAKENGIELTELIQNLADEIEKAGNAPPPMIDGANGNNDFFSQFFSEDNSDNTKNVGSV
jgi:hypothetical protein